MHVLRIEGGVVVNVEEWDEPPADTDEAAFRASTTGGIGWAYDLANDILTPPAPVAAPVPQTASMRNARLALHAAGLLAAVQAAVDAADVPTQIYWDYSAEVERRNPVMLALAAGLGLTDEQVDGLFVAAAAYG